MTIFRTSQKEKSKINQLSQELERLFNNNPIDASDAELGTEEYGVLIKAAKIMTCYYDFPLAKDSKEWSYFKAKWNALHYYQPKEQLKNFNTYHDIFVAILENWKKMKSSPYTYRCVASLIRMLGEEQG